LTLLKITYEFTTIFVLLYYKNLIMPNLEFTIIQLLINAVSVIVIHNIMNNVSYLI